MPTGENLSQFNKDRAQRTHLEQLTYYTVVDSGCWNWNRSISLDGYGKLKRYGVTLRAHRVFYETFVGPIADGLHVLHRCDNPLCVNPEHLFLGSHSDNMQDMNHKRRRGLHMSVSCPEAVPKGEQHGMSKLTEAQVRSIKNSRVSSYTLADEYGVHPTTIQRIRRGKIWSHV